jgi:hypothetical protein
MEISTVVDTTFEASRDIVARSLAMANSVPIDSELHTFAQSHALQIVLLFLAGAFVFFGIHQIIMMAIDSMRRRRYQRGAAANQELLFSSRHGTETSWSK